MNSTARENIVREYKIALLEGPHIGLVQRKKNAKRRRFVSSNLTLSAG